MRTQRPEEPCHTRNGIHKCALKLSNASLRNFGANRTNRTLLSAVSRDGGVNRAAFEYYLRELLLPCLRPVQIMVLDNLSVHHGSSIEALASSCSTCRLLPDLNPIEPMFAKIKALLKRAGALTRSALGMATKEALGAVTLNDIQGFYTLLGFQRQTL